MVLISSVAFIFVEKFFGFRPLAGIMVLILVDHQGIEPWTPWFPSPCGDYGSYPRRVSR